MSGIHRHFHIIEDSFCSRLLPPHPVAIADAGDIENVGPQSTLEAMDDIIPFFFYELCCLYGKAPGIEMSGLLYPSSYGMEDYTRACIRIHFLAVDVDVMSSLQ